MLYSINPNYKPLIQDGDKFINPKKMFNTFNSDLQEPSFGRKEKALMKERLIELNNLSTIQLNPWHDDPSKSPIYEEHEGFPSFIKPSLKNTNIIKYALPKQQILKHQNRIIIQRKKIDPKNLAKRQSHLIRGRNKLLSEEQDLQKMSKTISVNNFEGEKMFSQHQSIQRPEKNLQRQEKRQRTTINNPMYGKFCINYSHDKQNAMQRRKNVSEAPAVKFQNSSIKQILNFRSKMSILSMDRDRADPERAKSIHEVRRRLKSTSEIMKRKDQSLQIGSHDISQRSDRELFCEKPQKPQKQKQQSEYVNLTTQLKSGLSQKERERVHSCSSGDKFKLGRRKNLYIGFRKFFNMGQNIKQKSLERKESIFGEIVNLKALMEQGQGEVIRKFEKLEEYAYEKSFIRKGN